MASLSNTVQGEINGDVFQLVVEVLKRVHETLCSRIGAETDTLGSWFLTRQLLPSISSSGGKQGTNWRFSNLAGDFHRHIEYCKNGKLMALNFNTSKLVENLSEQDKSLLGIAMSIGQVQKSEESSKKSSMQLKGGAARFNQVITSAEATKIFEAIFSASMIARDKAVSGLQGNYTSEIDQAICIINALKWQPSKGVKSRKGAKGALDEIESAEKSLMEIRSRDKGNANQIASCLQQARDRPGLPGFLARIIDAMLEEQAEGTLLGKYKCSTTEKGTVEERVAQAIDLADDDLLIRSAQTYGLPVNIRSKFSKMSKRKKIYGTTDGTRTTDDDFFGEEEEDEVVNEAEYNEVFESLKSKLSQELRREIIRLDSADTERYNGLDQNFLIFCLLMYINQSGVFKETMKYRPCVASQAYLIINGIDVDSNRTDTSQLVKGIVAASVDFMYDGDNPEEILWAKICHCLAIMPCTSVQYVEFMTNMGVSANAMPSVAERDNPNYPLMGTQRFTAEHFQKIADKELPVMPMHPGSAKGTNYTSRNPVRPESQIQKRTITGLVKVSSKQKGQYATSVARAAHSHMQNLYNADRTYKMEFEYFEPTFVKIGSFRISDVLDIDANVKVKPQIDWYNYSPAVGYHEDPAIADFAPGQCFRRVTYSEIRPTEVDKSEAQSFIRSELELDLDIDDL